MFSDISRCLGNDVLMYASDYPPYECQYPDSVTNIPGWSSLGAERRRKLLWENANRYFRHA
jgi:predicted TIM-barrel fold metal-dependent hydrolase